MAIPDNKLGGQDVLHVGGPGARVRGVPRAQRRGVGRGRAALAVLRRLVLALPGAQGGHALLGRGRQRYRERCRWWRSLKRTSGAILLVMSTVLSTVFCFARFSLFLIFVTAMH